MHSMAKFLLDLATVDYGMLRFLPSQQAAAALCISLRLYNDHTIQWVMHTYCYPTTSHTIPWCVQCVYQISAIHPAAPQNATLEHYTGYTETDLLPCMQKLAQLVVRMPLVKQQAIREKYSSKRFLRVAKEPALFGETIRELAAQSQ